MWGDSDGNSGGDCDCNLVEVWQDCNGENNSITMFVVKVIDIVTEIMVLVLVVVLTKVMMVVWWL